MHRAVDTSELPEEAAQVETDREDLAAHGDAMTAMVAMVETGHDAGDVMEAGVMTAKVTMMVRTVEARISSCPQLSPVNQ